MRCNSTPWRPVLASLALVAAAAAPLAGQCESESFFSPHQFLQGDNFGRSFASAGDELVIGSSKAGVTTFVRNPGPSALDLLDDTWVEQDHLASSLSSWTEYFGASVALDGDFLVVGAPGDFFTLAFVRVYRRDAGVLAANPLDDTWIEQAYLYQDHAYGGTQYFGDGVLAAASQIFVAAPAGDPGGVVYVFGHDDGGTPDDLADDSWFPVQVLEGQPDPYHNTIGETMTLVGEHLLLGQAGSSQWSGPGAVHDFVRDDAGTPGEQADDLWLAHGTLTPQSSSEIRNFGSGLAADADRVLVSALDSVFELRLLDHGTPDDPTDDTWEQLAELLTEPELLAGSSVALQGDVALVPGAVIIDPFWWDSTVWFFRRLADGSWGVVAEPEPPTFASDLFGYSVAFAGDFGLIGDIGVYHALPQDSTYGFVVSYALVSPPWSYIDAALAGGPGEPVLFGAGSLVAGEPLVLTLDKAAPLALGLAVVGGSPVNLAAFGGLLVPSPDRLLAFTTDTAGMLALTSEWPAGLPSGMELLVQAWIQDAGAPQGWAASNALGLVAP